MGIETPKTESGDERIRNPDVAEVMARAEKEYQDLLRSEEADLKPEERKTVEEMSAKVGARAEKHARGHLDFEGLISAMEIPERDLEVLRKVYGENAEAIAGVVLGQGRALKKETFAIASSSEIYEAMRAAGRKELDFSVFSTKVGTRSTLRSWQAHFRKPRVVEDYLRFDIYNLQDYPTNFPNTKLQAIYRYEWARTSALRELLYLSTLDAKDRRSAVDALNGDTWEWRAPNGYGYSDEQVEQNVKDAVRIAAAQKMILEARSADELKLVELISSEEIAEEERATAEELLPMIEMNRGLLPEAAEKVDGVVAQYGFVWNEKIGHYVTEKKEE